MRSASGPPVQRTRPSWPPGTTANRLWSSRSVHVRAERHRGSMRRILLQQRVDAAECEDAPLTPSQHRRDRSTLCLRTDRVPRALVRQQQVQVGAAGGPDTSWPESATSRRHHQAEPRSNSWECGEAPFDDRIGPGRRTRSRSAPGCREFALLRAHYARPARISRSGLGNPVQNPLCKFIHVHNRLGVTGAPPTGTNFIAR